MVTISVYDSFPGFLFFDTRYVNTGNKDLRVHGWMNNNYQILKQNSTPDFWSFQGSSTSARADWVLPLKPGFWQENYMGMNDSDYGGGIPVVDVWRKDAGLAVGHLSMVPKEVSLPVDYDQGNNYATVGIMKRYDDFQEFNTGDTLKTIATFVTVHKGDYFSTLKTYSKIMQKKGIAFAPSEPGAFEPVWCGWGYERTFTKEEFIGTLPKVKELGIRWAVIDDGYQIAEGDWRVDKERFKGGEKDMKEMVDAIHGQGLKAKLWWAPLAADPGSKVLKDDPLRKLINKQGAPQYITWWDSYYLSPAYEGTLDYTRKLIHVFMEDWGFDGLKMDGQHMNAVPPEYNWERPLDNPNESVEELPSFFKMIYETAREIKPHAVLENCPCGCCMSFYNMPYANQFVSSDPLSSWQVRLKGKTYKAIAPHTAYYGDHVELSDSGNDFASSLGIGAVLGTKFTWPENNPDVKENYLLTPEKEKIWKKWFGLYNHLMLSKGNYLGNLYDLGYDVPETHVIQKGNTYYFAFYNKKWKGKVSFKGLSKDKTYQVKDYFNDIDLGQVKGTAPQKDLDFTNFLLLELTPLN
jgi:alpha-galactosidase